MPRYLQHVWRDYLHDRYITYRGQLKKEFQREVNCGVPQGSVLGPLLWNLGYNWVLRGALLTGLSLVCYADDTLVLAGGESWDEAIRLARTDVRIIVGRIESLGLKVAIQKTEVMYFTGARGRGPLQSHIQLGTENIVLGSHMEYLGLTLDSKWRWDEHFTRLASKIRGAINCLGRLLPNLGGPKERKRRLYMAVVASMALYGAPAWSGSLTAKSERLLLELQLWRLG